LYENLEDNSNADFTKKIFSSVWFSSVKL
jgi:hypothetical protein